MAQEEEDLSKMTGCVPDPARINADTRLGSHGGSNDWLNEFLERL